MKKVCQCGCGRPIDKIDNRGRERFFKVGHVRGMLGKKHTEETKRKMSIAQKGLKKKPFSKKARMNISKAAKGKIPWNKGIKTGLAPWLGKKRLPFSLETRKKMSEARKGMTHSEETKKRMSRLRVGENNPSWKGGITPLRTKIWKSKKYQEWSINVKIRDKYICKHCGQKGGKLHTDHIEPFFYLLEKYKIKSLSDALSCKELWILGNGRTLCVPCHRKTDTYGGKAVRYIKNFYLYG